MVNTLRAGAYVSVAMRSSPELRSLTLHSCRWTSTLQTLLAGIATRLEEVVLVGVERADMFETDVQLPPFPRVKLLRLSAQRPISMVGTTYPDLETLSIGATVEIRDLDPGDHVRASRGSWHAPKLHTITAPPTLVLQAILRAAPPLRAINVAVDGSYPKVDGSCTSGDWDPLGCLGRISASCNPATIEQVALVYVADNLDRPLQAAPRSLDQPLASVNALLQLPQFEHLSWGYFDPSVVDWAHASPSLRTVFWHTRIGEGEGGGAGWGGPPAALQPRVQWHSLPRHLNSAGTSAQTPPPPLPTFTPPNS